MREVIQQIKEEFDMAIFDTPAIVPLADAGILATQLDGVILVVQAGRTQRHLVRQAYEHLKQVQSEVLGLVFTHAHYYIPRYRNYYSYYYRRYGKTEAKEGKAGQQAVGV